MLSKYKGPTIRCHFILYRGSEHPWIWVSEGVLKHIPLGYQGLTVYSCKVPVFYLK